MFDDGRPHQPRLSILHPEDARQRALLAPRADELTGIDRTDEEWDALYKALANR